jgi:hypothetical protein
VQSCEFALDGVVDLELACQGSVLLDGEAQECGVDWELLDPSTLRLLGTACQTIKDGQAHELSASWPCGAVEVP